MSESVHGRVCIMLLTAHRPDYAAITLRSTLLNRDRSVPVRVHIASDGDDAEYIEFLQDIAQAEGVSEHLITISNSQGRGYGANYNAATQIVHSLDDVAYVLPLEDDWELVRALPLSDLCSILDSDVGIGCLRLGYIGFTQELRSRFVAAGGDVVLHLDSESAEPHVFAGHPRLETVEWERSVGPWPEGINPGATEFEVAHLPAARHGVAWPINLIKPCGDMFVHIGTERSY